MVSGNVTSCRSASRFAARALFLLVSAAGGCIEHASPEAKALLVRGSRAYGASNIPAAIAAMDEFLAGNSRTAEAEMAYYLRGLAQWRAGDANAARQDLEAAADRARTRTMHFNAIKALGDLAIETGDANQAVTLYTQALEEADANSPLDEVRYGLGCALQRQGQWWHADAQFDRLLHDFPASRLAAPTRRRIRCQAWTFQIAAFSQKGLADDESARLAKIGLPTTVEPTIASDRLEFVVQAGRYDTYAQAAAHAEQVRRFATAAPLVPTRLSARAAAVHEP